VKYALISDIHGNLPALEAVLAHIDSLAEAIPTFHLGDLVGYAPWPNEVVALLAERGIFGVAGNYDSTTATNYKHCGCKYENPRQEELAHESYQWTRQHATPGTKQLLAALPFRLDLRPRGGHLSGPKLVLVHGTPTLNTLYWTEDRPDSFCKQMAEIAGIKAGDVIAFGHTHKPWQRVVDEILFVNTGSVGKPKDGDPRAGYTLIDFEGEGPSARHIRVPYDVERAAAGIIQSDLPNEFAADIRGGTSG
jgi:predicted phosphodiesterase